MTIKMLLIPAAMVATMAVAAVPAYAQHHGGGGGGHSGGGGSRGAGVSRGAGSSGGGEHRGGGGTASRGVAQGRSYPSSVYRGGVVVRGGGRVVVGSRGFIRGGPVFYRPYYTFRPRASLGFGLWLGYPIAYPYYYASPYGYGYPDPYAYPYPADPYAYGSPAPSSGYPAQPYPPSNDPYGGSAQGYPQQQSAPSVGVQRGGQQSSMGGVSFEITPDTAEVFVDGNFVGTAATFGPRSQPLGLDPGRHQIEIRASGYRTMTFDADVTAGQVLPYQGTLQRN